MRIEQKYAELLGFIWFSLFYSIFSPISLFITLSGILFTYFIDKVFFYCIFLKKTFVINRYRIPEYPLTSRYTLYFIELLQISAIFPIVFLFF